MMASTKNDPHPHGPHVITYSATLDVPEATAVLLTDLLIAERRRRGTGIGARAASARIQAVLVLRWFREATSLPTLARDAGVSQGVGKVVNRGSELRGCRCGDDAVGCPMSLCRWQGDRQGALTWRGGERSPCR